MYPGQVHQHIPAQNPSISADIVCRPGGALHVRQQPPRHTARPAGLVRRLLGRYDRGWCFTGCVPGVDEEPCPGFLAACRVRRVRRVLGKPLFPVPPFTGWGHAFLVLRLRRRGPHNRRSQFCGPRPGGAATSALNSIDRSSRPRRNAAPRAGRHPSGGPSLGGRTCGQRAARSTARIRGWPSMSGWSTIWTSPRPAMRASRRRPSTGKPQ